MKMKLRRRRKEEGDCHRTLCLHPARLQPEPRSVLALLFPSSFHPLPPPSPHQSATCRTHLVSRHVPPSSCSSYPSSSCSASPFLLHKITEAARYGIRRVALYSTCRPSLPAQLAGLAIAAPSSPHPCPFTKSGAGSSPVLMASSLWRVES